MAHVTNTFHDGELRIVHVNLRSGVLTLIALLFQLFVPTVEPHLSGPHLSRLLSQPDNPPPPKYVYFFTFL